MLNPATHVLANDSDPDGTPLTAALLAEPNHGVMVLGSADKFIYIPDAGFTGTDVFSYTASDGELSDTEMVTITIPHEVHLPFLIKNQ